MKNKLLKPDALLNMLEDLEESKKSIEESEKNFRNFFEKAVFPMIVLDQKGIVINVNNAFEKSIGYKKKEMIGFNIFKLNKFILPENRKPTIKNFKKRQKGLHIAPYEIKIKAKNGKIKIFEVNASVTKQKRKTNTLVIFRDLTEIKKAEEEMKKSKKTIEILNNVSEKLYKSLEKKEIYKIVAGELKKFGFEVTFLNMKDKKNLHLEYSSYLSEVDSKILKMLELVKIDIRDIDVPKDIFINYDDVLKKGKSIYFDDYFFKNAIKEFFPEVISRFGAKFLKLLGNPKFTVISPIIIKNKIIGSMGITSDNLNKKDVSAIKAFANQISIALENAELYGQAKKQLEITQKQNIQLKKLEKKLKKYAKQLEIKLEKIENGKTRLTDKEKLVLWGITRYPYDNDLKLSKKLKIKRSTITAIRNRLKRNEMYSVMNISSKILEKGLITFAYGRFNIDFEKRTQAREGILKYFTPHCVIHSDNEFIDGIVSKDMADFEKKTSLAMDSINKNKVLKNLQIVHFLLELNKIYKFFGYADLLKAHFNIKIKEKQEKEKQPNKNLSKNEKRVLLAMIEYPELSAYDLSFKVDLTRPTVSKIRKRLFKDGLVTTIVIPALEKIGFELMMLNHIKQIGLSNKSINLILEKNSNLVFFIGGHREAIGISLYKDYQQYKESRQRLNRFNKEIFLEEPVMFKILTKNIKIRKFDFLEAAKRLLD